MDANQCLHTLLKKKARTSAIGGRESRIDEDMINKG